MGLLSARQRMGAAALILAASTIISRLMGLVRDKVISWQFGAGGEADICITLRTALFADDCIFVQAGAGVVADSDPVAEYAETQHKARAPMRAAEDAWRFRSGNR